MLKQVIKKAVYTLAPKWAASADETRWLVRQARETAILGTQLPREAFIEQMRAHPFLLANQKQSEIAGLLGEAAVLMPKTLVEIGSAGGGTLALFCSVVADGGKVLSLDIAHTPAMRKAYPLLGGDRVHVTCLTADSHAEATRAQVEAWAGGRTIDVLFIDGDHSFAGVAADYKLFGPLVRPGGIIGFHDICPDERTRGRPATVNDVGEVPRFWRELTRSEGVFMQWIEHPEQDGYGIGMLRVPPDGRLPAVLT